MRFLCAILLSVIFHASFLQATEPSFKFTFGSNLGNIPLEINKISNARLSFLNNRSNDILIYPGSVIYIPRKVFTRDPTMIASIWAPILSSLALSLTSLSVLDSK